MPARVRDSAWKLPKAPQPTITTEAARILFCPESPMGGREPAGSNAAFHPESYNDDGNSRRTPRLRVHNPRVDWLASLI